MTARRSRTARKQKKRLKNNISTPSPTFQHATNRTPVPLYYSQTCRPKFIPNLFVVKKLNSTLRVVMFMLLASCSGQSYVKTPDGIVVKIVDHQPGGAEKIRLQVIDDRMVHV